MIIFTSACGYIQSVFAAEELSQGKYIVDPQFDDLYQRLGGVETLGPAITPLFWQGHLRLQYTEASLMAFDPLAVPNHFLMPLGFDLGYLDPVVENTGQPDGQYVGGHFVYSEFLLLYEFLGGEAVVGPPLTEVRHNIEKTRLEQHFGNLGIYISLDDPIVQAHLLAYGVFSCDFSCPYTPIESAIIEKEINLPEPFATAANFLGSDFLGDPLDGPYEAGDGNTQIIFENIVLFVDPINSGRVMARPIVEYIGFSAHQPVERLNTDLVIFFTLEDERGFNIPVIFGDFLAKHGGLDIAGNPISEIFRLEEGVTRQCFTNLCLDYREDSQSITVAPLGAIYKAYTIRSDSDIRILDVPTPPTELQIRVWEENAFITSQEEQILYISVFDEGVALAGIVPTLTLTLPTGIQTIYRFAPTDESGMTFISIPPVEAINGTLIFYEICVENTDAGVVCAQDNYLIWGNR
ncbi:MAG: hypothetical protein IH859_08065 [Chloroflexi bacterium]|nr:hypothetical protein [Chloroflexota bacterium]